MSANDVDSMSPVPIKYRAAFAILKSMYNEDVGARLKSFESTIETSIPPEKPFVIRLDGVAFSTFTEGLRKPFDDRLKTAMVNVTVDLLNKFVPSMAYHHSDEISLVFLAADPPLKGARDDSGKLLGEDPSAQSNAVASDELGLKRQKKLESKAKTHPYSGRVQKLSSVTAAYATARLNHHLRSFDWADLSSRTQERMTAGEAYFDGRVVAVPDLAAAAECVLWRSSFDGFRNAISSIAQARFSSKQLHGKNVPRMIEMLATEGLNIWDLYTEKYLFGTWVKKEVYEVHGYVVPKLGKVLDQPITRRRVRTGSFNWANYSEEDRIRFMASKYWPSDENSPPKDALMDE
ncbi:tRNAHis guanylyltransferase-domain-containing protein [Zopfochytrium polystomum]|nr:tRNAHis guanylyltransferase-domain-containing protein [Zopfochytrium polystomum]